MALDQRIFDLEICETLVIVNDEETEVQTWTRVPGGWVLRLESPNRDSENFVPFSREGKEGDPPMDKQCTINLQATGTIDCEKGDRGAKCCCFLTNCAVLPCGATAQDVCDFVDQLPPYSQVSWLEDFGNDGWVIIWKTPKPGTCDDTGTTQDPSTGEDDD